MISIPAEDSPTIHRDVQGPELTAIVVSWNATVELRRCLQSILASRGLRIKTIVVDNASSEGNADMVRSDFPAVELIINSSNRGFAAAVNQGLERSIGDVVLINSDLDLQSFTLMNMRRALERHPEAGIVGPKLVYPNGRLQPSIKRFPRWSDLWLVLSKLPNFRPQLARRYQAMDIDYGREQPVDQVMGSCFLIRRAVIEAIGRFDERFWMWFEEVDYCLRAKTVGWSTLYTPTATAVHVRGASFSRFSTAAKQRALRQSILAYSQKYFGGWRTMLLKPAGLVSLVSAPVIDILKLDKPQRARDF